MLLSKLQRAALKRVYHRAVLAHSYGPMTTAHFMNYRAFRRTVHQGTGCIMVQYAGMWVGIEPDGYTHT
jgi:hypothetical protein